MGFVVGRSDGGVIGLAEVVVLYLLTGCDACNFAGNGCGFGPSLLSAASGRISLDCFSRSGSIPKMCVMSVCMGGACVGARDIRFTRSGRRRDALAPYLACGALLSLKMGPGLLGRNGGFYRLACGLER